MAEKRKSNINGTRIPQPGNTPRIGDVKPPQKLDMLYQCHSCGYGEIIKSNDIRKDGRCFEICGEHTSPTGYIGIDLAKKIGD